MRGGQTESPRGRAWLILVGAFLLAAGVVVGVAVERVRDGGAKAPVGDAAGTTTQTTGRSTPTSTSRPGTTVSEPPPTVPKPGPGVFAGGFERGDWRPFTTLQREDDRPESESFAVVEEPVRQGRYAARMTVRQGYSRFGYNEDTEVVWQGGEKPGDEYWYAWSTLFPVDWQPPYHWGIFAQWHANLGTSPIIALNARADTADLTVRSGRTDETGNSFAVVREAPLLDTLSKGRWNDFVLHVRWRTEADGLVEVFHRVEGEPALRRVARVEGVPTFQWTTEGSGIGTYLLLGLYRGSYCPQPTELGCDSELGTQAPNVIFQDGFSRASTYEDAAAYAFPGPVPTLP